MQRANVLAAALLLVLSCSAPAAVPYYQSATMGTPGQTSGHFLGDSQFIGVRFAVSSPVTIHRIGGHIGKSGFPGDGSLFGALIKLTSMTDMPDSLNLSTPDVLATTTFFAPAGSQDIAVGIGPITLTPGTYGVLFGSGLFGATGTGIIPVSTNIGSPSYFWRDSENPPTWRHLGLAPVRLTVYEVPEPASLSILALGMTMLRRTRRATR